MPISRSSIRDYPMPFFEEKVPLHVAPPQNEVALRWGEKVASLDGHILVTAEYTHSIPAVRHARSRSSVHAHSRLGDRGF
jgi:NAD(P)H-dependent FMN reductase